MKAWMFAALISLCGCTTLIDDQTNYFIGMPDRSTSAAEVAAAIQATIAAYPLCNRLPALRLMGKAVDFHKAILKDYKNQNAEAELDRLVRLGYLTKTARLDLGWRVLEYQPTERGKDAIITDAVGRREFCLPAERKLLSVTETEWVVHQQPFPDKGYLFVRFTHTIDPDSIWLRNAELVRLMDEYRLDDALISKAEPFGGTAHLYRVWDRSKHPLKGAPQSGELQAIEYDGVHNRYVKTISLGIGF